MVIIGVVGPIGAGKSEVCRILEKLGYFRISLSDILREEARKRGLSTEREVLRKLGDELRAKLGKGALAKLAIEELRKKGIKRAVIDSVRLPEEVKEIEKAGGFCIGVTAPIELRWSRIAKRGRDKYRSFEEFKEADAWDRSLGIDDALELCRYVIANIGSLGELEEDLGKILINEGLLDEHEV